MVTGLAMRKTSAKVFLGFYAALSGIGVATAQDVPGIEICTRESRLDRRTGCLQSNIEFLQQVMNRNALDAQQRLTAANRDIAALKEALAAANRDIAALREAIVAASQARNDQDPKTNRDIRPDAQTGTAKTGTAKTGTKDEPARGPTPEPPAK